MIIASLTKIKVQSLISGKAFGHTNTPLNPILIEGKSMTHPLIPAIKMGLLLSPLICH